MPDTRVFSTVDCLVLILLLGAASAQTQARGLPLQATRALLADHHADDYQERVDPESFLKAEELQEEEKIRGRWISDTPHSPEDDLDPALARAAFPVSGSKGLVIVTSGSRFAFHHLLPRWLDSLARSRDGDLTRYALVGALGLSAMHFCQAAKHSHQCVAHTHWPGPDRQYHFGDDWYVAVTLSKVEFLTNILALGYALFWVDTDVVFFASPLPHLADMQADMAVGLERCDVISNFSSGYQGPFSQNTGTILLKPTDAAKRFVASWLGFQRKHLIDWGPNDFDKLDGNQRRSDQVTLNRFALPHLVGEDPGQPHYLNIQALDHQHFPNYCGGYCGCEGAGKREAMAFIRFENSRGHLMSGRVDCPAHIMQDWYTYHFPCTMSTAEKAALLDCYQHLADRTHSTGLASPQR